MPTTNNVPQSRCRAFLIYGELSEMGRWSKRRWRHAEGLRFPLFSPHKQEKPVSVCHNSHKHTPTQRSKTQAHAQTQASTTPTLYMHTSNFQHNSTLPCSPKQVMHGYIPHLDTHTPTHAFITKNDPPAITPSQTHTTKSSGFGWTRLRTLSNELPPAPCGVCRK